MLNVFWLDLQYFAEGGAPGGEGGGEAAGVESADAGQSMEARLEQLGVPKDKIRKGAYKGKTAPPAAEPTAAPAADQTAQSEEAQDPSGAADRKTWDEIKADYKADYDAEVQNIIQKRLKNSQERIQKYTEREEGLAPLIDFFADRYGLDPENLDAAELIKKFREDASLSEQKALEMGASDEVAHKLELAEQEEKRKEREKKARDQQLAEAFKRQQVADHYGALQTQAAELAKRIPGFDLDAELQNDAFAEMTRPGSKVTVEQAYYALHPEFRQREIESVAAKAKEAVSASVRAGATRPTENGTQAASVGAISYRNMSKEDREALKQRIRAAGARGEHLPYGG